MPEADNRTDGAGLRLEGSRVCLSGRWTVLDLDELETRVARLKWPPQDPLVFDAGRIRAMDTAGAWFLFRTVVDLRKRGRAVQLEGLSPSSRTLLALVETQQEPALGVAHPRRPSSLENIGRSAFRHMRQFVEFLTFAGQTAHAAWPLLLRPTRMRWKATLVELADAGYRALGIVGLLSFLIGVVIAYQGGFQLRQYGASIYVADLVGLSMLRELAPLITAIIVAGRTGSAYTASIGTMQVTDEVDALRTLGVTPVELLVLPKMLALIVALPLLTIFADFVGLLGGMVMTNYMLGIGFPAFLDRISYAVSPASYLIGIGKAPVFAVLIVSVGCYQGFRVRGSAESVGRHTTTAVVQSVFLVIVVDAAFSIVFSGFGI